MERYEAYKDSGVEWIGEIPAGWEVHRLKYMASNRVIPADSDAGRYLGLEQVQSWTMSIVDEADETDAAGILYDEACVLFGKLRPYLAKVALPNSSGPCSSEFLVLLPLSINRTYLAYALVNELFINEVNAMTYGVRMPRAGWDLVGNLQLPVPPNHEQERIADYLDAKTAEIDALVADCEREVGLLREYRKAVISEAVTKGLDAHASMKDSGVEWIGEIPSSWKTSKLRYCGTTQNGISKGGEYFGTGHPFISYGNAYRNELDKPELFGLIESTADERERYGIKRGDVLFTRTSETIEEVGIAAGALREIADCCFAGFLIRFRPSGEWGVLPEYAAYYFRSDLYRPYLTKEMVLVTRASMSQQLLGGITVLIPPANEQRAIVAYLDARTAEIDSLIEAKQSMADKLREYRKSLISEAVTGKFRVPSEWGREGEGSHA